MARKPDLAKRKKALDFIAKYNAEHGGRGGITAAANKYKVHPITVGKWVKEEGLPEVEASEAAAPKAAAKKSRKKAAAASPKSAPVTVDKKSVMDKIEEIQDLENHIANLQTRVAEIKGEIKAML
ncbi:MAG: hypothetical protein ACLFSB_05265 [Chitinispirillaceae bacterium]